jgi:transcription initiation factor TFIIB
MKVDKMEEKINIFSGDFLVLSRDNKGVVVIEERRCPECESKNLIEDPIKGEIVCGDCGFVIGIKVDRGPERRVFTPEDAKERIRTGPAADWRYHDKGLTTSLTSIEKDAWGKKLREETIALMRRLRRLQFRVRVASSKERNLSRAFNELSKLCNHLNLPKHVEITAAIYYRMALDKGLIRGRSIEEMIAACLYLACRMTKVPRSLLEIANVSFRRRKEIAKYYRFLIKELRIKSPIQDPIQLVNRGAERLNVSQATIKIAIEILREAKRKGFWAGKSREGLAAAALYIAACKNPEERRVTQREISEAYQITEVTIRNIYRGLTESLNSVP